MLLCRAAKCIHASALHGRFLGVVAVFIRITEDGCLRKTVALDAPPITKIEESAKHLADLLVGVVERFHIDPSKIIGIMTDGARNARAIRKCMPPRFDNLHTLPPCLAHAGSLFAKSVATLDPVKKAYIFAQQVYNVFAHSGKARATAGFVTAVETAADGNPEVRQVLREAVDDLSTLLKDHQANRLGDVDDSFSEDSAIHTALGNFVADATADRSLSVAGISFLPRNARFAIPGACDTRFASLHALFKAVSEKHMAITATLSTMPAYHSVNLSDFVGCRDMTSVFEPIKAFCASASETGVTLGRGLVLVLKLREKLQALGAEESSDKDFFNNVDQLLCERFPMVVKPEKYPLHMLSMALDPSCWQQVSSTDAAASDDDDDNDDEGIGVTTHDVDDFYPFWW